MWEEKKKKTDFLAFPLLNLIRSLSSWNMPCCGCKGDGTCIRCQCTNAGRPCVRCYPSRRHRCANPAKQRPLGSLSSSQQDLPSTSRLGQSQPLPNRVTTTSSQRTRSRSSESYKPTRAQPSSARALTACSNQVCSSIDDESADGRASIPVFGSSVGTLSSCPMSAIANTMATNQASLIVQCHVSAGLCKKNLLIRRLGKRAIFSG